MTTEPQEARSVRINTPSQLLRHSIENLQNKGGNLVSHSLCLSRLEIGNSVSQPYSSSHDHDSGVQSLQQGKKKRRKKKKEKVKLGNPTKKSSLVLRRNLGVDFGINLGD